MEQYVEFSEFYRKHILNKEAHENWKKNSAVHVPFVLKP